jgi:spermidine/putrescine transport system ATP-binding protein
MNLGRFEQVGTPQQLYYEPQTAFVAGFVGANNRVSGRAGAVEQGLVTLASARGLALRARAIGTVRPGDEVEAFVRPEVLALARDAGTIGGPGWVRCQGVVDSLLFDGANSALLLHEAASGIEFRVALPQTGQWSDLAVGTPLHFGFDPQRAVCFAATASAAGDAA